jgi:hypothetical protein
LEVSLGNKVNETPSLSQARRGGALFNPSLSQGAQVVERLPSKHKMLRSNLVLPKKKKKSKTPQTADFLLQLSFK